MISLKRVKVASFGAKHCSVVSIHLSTQYNELVVKCQMVMPNTACNINSSKNVTPVNSWRRMAVYRRQVNYHCLAFVDWYQLLIACIGKWQHICTQDSRPKVIRNLAIANRSASYKFFRPNTTVEIMAYLWRWTVVIDFVQMRYFWDTDNETTYDFKGHLRSSAMTSFIR